MKLNINKFFMCISILFVLLCISCKKPHTHQFNNGECSCGMKEEIKYQITFKDYDGTILKIVTINQEDKVIPPTNPVREGFVFLGWDHNLDNIESDLVVNARYVSIDEKYRISFVLEEGLWYYSSKEEMVKDFLNDFYDFVKPIESRQTFIYGGESYDATWSNYIGGSVGYKNYLIFNNDIDVENEEYFFNSSLYKSKWYKLSSYIKNQICRLNKRFGYPDVTYSYGALDFKRYIENDPSIYLNSYGGEDIFYGFPKDELIKPEIYQYTSDDIILPIPVSPKFEGWYLSEDCNGEKIDRIPSGSIGDKTFFAKTTDEYYVISFDTKSNEYLDDIIVTNNSLVTLPSISKEGYIFQGWYLDYKLIDNQFIYNYDVSIKLVAKWKKEGNVGFNYLEYNDKIVTYRNSFVAVEIPEEYIQKETELRAVWVSSITGCYTPNTDQTLMKQALLEVLELLDYYNMNCMIFHLRTHNNAFYKTRLAPIDKKYGTYESMEEWDYVPWLIEECHKRGIEFHAWLNPYRIALSGISLDATTNDVALDYQDCRENPASNPENILMTYVSSEKSQGAILNPAKKEVQDYLVNVCIELAQNYDIDAIHFDDYFYQRLNSDDTAILIDADQSDYIDYINNNATSLKVDSYQDKQAWRRYNVDCLIEKIHNALSSLDKKVKFGISPTGVYKSGDGSITSGSNTTPSGHYNAPLFADTYKWIKEGWIDYIMPQCYTSFDYKNFSFHDITTWWNKAIEGTNVSLYIGMGLYQSNSSDNENSWSTQSYELDNQLLYLNTLDNVKGCVFFNFKSLKEIYNNSNCIANPALQRLAKVYWTKKVTVAD